MSGLPNITNKNGSVDRPLSVYDNLNTTLASPISYPVNANHGLATKEQQQKLPCDANTVKPTTQVNHDDDNYSLLNDRNNPKIHSERNHHSMITTCKFSPVTSQQATGDSIKPEIILADKPVISDAKLKFFGINNNNVNAKENTSEFENNHKQRQQHHHHHSAAPARRKYENVPEFCELPRKESNNNCSVSSTSLKTSENASPLRESLTDVSAQKGDAPSGENHQQSKPYLYDMEITTNQQQPSQVVYMATTVPQNIKGVNIAGRHTPTRNSLRHSRMIVVNKNFKGSKQPDSFGLKFPRLANALLIMQIIIGIIIAIVGGFIMLWAPSTRIQDNPYWSGLSLTFAGVLGLVVLRFKRIKRQTTRENCFAFIKVDSIILTTLACTLCFIAFVCAAVHLNTLSLPTTKCVSANILISNAACICIYNVSDNNNGTLPILSDAGGPVSPNEFLYRDLNCGEVNGTWKFLLTLSIILNVLGFLVTVTYLILLCFRKNPKKNYTPVSVNPF